MKNKNERQFVMITLWSIVEATATILGLIAAIISIRQYLKDRHQKK